MRPRLHVAPLLAALVLQAGCGLLLGSGPDPIVQGRLPEPPKEAPPTTFIYTGEIMDFATFRPEPEAIIEFWSEYPSYTPTVRLDGRGGFSIRVDTCRRPATTLDDVMGRLLADAPTSCLEWIGRFGLRARAGSRCSLPLDGKPPSGPGRVILWMKDCVELQHGAHDWRPARKEPGPPAPG